MLESVTGRLLRSVVRCRLDQEWHLTVLQRLFRCRYLQLMGLNPADAARLITEAINLYQQGDAIRRPNREQ